MAVRIPESVEKNAAGYIGYLGSQVDLVGKVWTHYAWAVSAAYAMAYDRVNTILGQVKRAQEKRRQAEHDQMVFALSLLTVGIGGAGAGAIARAATESRDAQDGIKKILEKIWSTTSEPAIHDLSPDKRPNADVFAPPGMTPAEYTAKLQEGISYDIALLAKLLDEVQYNPAASSFGYDGKVINLKSGGKLTDNEAKRLTEAILNSTFFVERPPIEVNSKNLSPKAELALWMGWAWTRDTAYWANAEQNYYQGWDRRTTPGVTKAGREQFEWWPVAQELISLGVPASQIRANIQAPEVPSGKLVVVPGLYFWGFMYWTTTISASILLFDNSLPKNYKGFEMARKQVGQKVLFRNGWAER